MEVSGRSLMNADLKKFNRLDRQRQREPLSSGKGVSGSTENKQGTVMEYSLGQPGPWTEYILTNSSDWMKKETEDYF